MAESENGFRYSVPDIPPTAQWISLAELEQRLLKELDEGDAPEATLWKIARMYLQAHVPDAAMEYVRRLLETRRDLESAAYFVFVLGQLMEQKGDYENAIRYYTEALAMEPCDPMTCYFIHNNLGYCHNHFGRFTDGEKLCRRAIEIDPRRPNGFKNLGIALQGQGKLAAAAAAFVQAVRVEAADPRALAHVEALVQEHPQVLAEMPELAQQLVDCRAAVRIAQVARERAMRVVGPPPNKRTKRRRGA